MAKYDKNATDMENIARALFYIGDQLKSLGNGNACSEVGAIEGLAMQIKDGLSDIAAAVTDG